MKDKSKTIKSECFMQNDFSYPLCKGANTPQEIAENECSTCCLYENYEGDGNDD